MAEAARLLARGHPLEALQQVALLEQPRALALRGVALAQLGDLTAARRLLSEAAKALDDDPVTRARCIAAAAEIGVAARDLTGPVEPVVEAAETLRRHGDHRNAAYAELVLARRALLLGRLDDVDASLAGLSFVQVPPTVATVAHLLAAEVATRRLQAGAARRALRIASRAARDAGILALEQEVAQASERADGVAARLVEDGGARAVTLDEVEDLLSEERLVVDACRRCLRRGPRSISLLERPVQFALLRALAEAGPAGVAREELITTVFEARRPNASHRSRLRVDIGRLRKAIDGWARPQATPTGYALLAPEPIAILLPPFESPHASLTALLGDGEPWSTAALALATGKSRRSVQRALAQLRSEGRVRAIGRGPARRWLSPPLSAIATAMLLPPVTDAG